MTLVEAVVLGLVQGLTEFLPISSSGHLVIVPDLLGWPAPSLPFVVLLHAATFLAVVVYFRQEIVSIVSSLARGGPGRRMAVLLTIGTIPAALAGALFEERVSEIFGSPRIAAALLIGTGLLLVVAETFSRRSRKPGEEVKSGVADLAEALSLRKALFIGIAQTASILPGFSRSGWTISAGLGAGLSRPAAARFSFLLSIPILFGAFIFELRDITRLEIESAAAAAGMLAAFVSGYLAIAGLIAYLQRRGLYPFAVYCLAAGTLGVFFLSR